KEIKSKPKIIGLEMRELVIILISSLLLLTILRELVHGLFMLLYLGISILAMIYLFFPSGNNPGKRNYESIVLMFRHKTRRYHALNRNDVNKGHMQTERLTMNRHVILVVDEKRHRNVAIFFEKQNVKKG